MSEGLSAIEEAWHEVNPDWAFEYFFVEDTFARLYDAEQRFGRIFISFSALAVVIACLGLVGLSSFTAERRRKEIGIRKVLGASAAGLVALLSREYFRLVIVANVVAWPVAYIAMNVWLGGFAYRIDLVWTTIHPGRRPRHGHRPAHGEFPGRTGGHRQSGRGFADGVASYDTAFRYSKKKYKCRRALPCGNLAILHTLECVLSEKKVVKRLLPVRK